MATGGSKRMAARWWLWTLSLALLSALPASGAELVPGDILVLACTNGPCISPERQIIRVDPDTGEQTIIASGGLLARPTGMAMDDTGQILVVDKGPATNDYPIAMVYDGKIIRIDPATGAQTMVAEGGLLLNPRSIAVGPNGDLYVLNQWGTTSGVGLDQLVRINPTTGVQTLLVSDYVDPPAPRVIHSDGLGRLL